VSHGTDEGHLFPTTGEAGQGSVLVLHTYQSTRKKRKKHTFFAKETHFFTLCTLQHKKTHFFAKKFRLLAGAIEVVTTIVKYMYYSNFWRI